MDLQDTQTPMVEMRKQIFQALVETQDGGTSVRESRALIAQRFTVTEALVREIEREGINSVWPPLSI
ncbi:MAG: hypothetical protein HY040_29345 [Planctomycetes bacterium]|nr:hypothetical protein [Planctomycetota bacterium]